MQDKSEHYSEFSERTDKLAVSLGKTLTGLLPSLGISNGMFFAYRNGKHKISAKAWRKLEALERSISGSERYKKPVNAGSERLTETVEEAPASYLALAEKAASDIRNLFNDLLDHAGDDLERLGWIRVQMRRHLEIPEDWGIHERVIEKVRQEREAREHALQKSHPPGKERSGAA
jgi:hypothetical protein